MGFQDQINKLFEIVTRMIQKLDRTNFQDKGRAAELSVFMQNSRNDIQSIKENIRLVSFFLRVNVYKVFNFFQFYVSNYSGEKSACTCLHRILSE